MWHIFIYLLLSWALEHFADALIDCEAKYTYKTDIKNYLKAVHEGYWWRCPEGFKEFNTPSGLRCHKEIHENIHSFVHFVAKVLHSIVPTRHMWPTIQEKSLCLCGKAYRAFSGLSTHNAVWNLEKAPPMSCLSQKKIELRGT